MNTRNRKKERGAAMVELALSLMILMFIVYGITEFSRILYIKNRLTYASREGARAAVVTTSPGLVLDAAKVAAHKVYPDAVVSIDPLYPVPGAGTPVTVTVIIHFQTVVPNLSPSFSPFSNIDLRGETTMRYEQ